MKLLQDEFLSEIRDRLRAYGFGNRPAGQTFARKKPFGREFFHLSFIKHCDDFDVTAAVSLRFDKVEELIDRYHVHKFGKPSANRSTLGCELGNLSEGAQKRWRVAAAEDIPGVATEIMDAFTAVALPYYEEFSQENRVLEVLSGDGRVSSLHSAINYARAERAVILALLLDGNDAARRLGALKLSFLEQRNDSGLAWFRNFLNNAGLL